jgi:ferredoxin
MEIKKAVAVHFSPTGTMARAITAFSAGMGLPTEAVDLTLPEKRKGCSLTFGKDELLVVGMPVYGGKLPLHLEDFFAGLHGDGTPAIATVIYGNRDYGDALVELAMRLKERNFVVKAAAAFIGQHSFSSKIATGRPDADDLAVIATFGRQAAAAIAGGTPGKLHFKGTYPFTSEGFDPAEPGSNPTRPPVLTSDDCNGCGLCADTCPWGAIDKNDFKKIDNTTCFRCFHCVKVCPTHAKNVADEKWLAFLPTFEARLNATRKEPELFLPG